MAALVMALKICLDLSRINVWQHPWKLTLALALSVSGKWLEDDEFLRRGELLMSSFLKGMHEDLLSMEFNLLTALLQLSGMKI